MSNVVATAETSVPFPAKLYMSIPEKMPMNREE